MRIKWLTVVGILAGALLVSSLPSEVGTTNKSIGKIFKLHHKRKVFFV